MKYSLKQLLFILPITVLLLQACTPPNKIDQTQQNHLDSIAHSLFFSDTLSILFVGDVMQHKPQITAARNRADKSYDYVSCFKYLAEDIGSADLAIANLETTLGNSHFSGYPMFCAPKELAVGLKNSGFNLIATANNHSLDRLNKGVELTIKTLDSLKIAHFGTYTNKNEKEANHPYFTQIKGYKLAFMNYTYGTNGLTPRDPIIINYIDTVEIKRDLAKANKKGAQIKIVYIHWGEEYQTKPNQKQKKLAKWLLKNGATHVIGSHPHVLQPIDIVTDSVSKESHIIAYSLGNFISNMSKKNTDGALVLKLKIYNNHSFLTTKATYALAWVGKPIHTKLKNYYLYPSSYPIDSLNTRSKIKFIDFKKNASKIMKHNHKAIKEYFVK